MTGTQCHLYSACHHGDSSVGRGGEGLGWVSSDVCLSCKKLRLRPSLYTARASLLGHSSTVLGYLALISSNSHGPFPQALRHAPQFLKAHLTFTLVSQPQLLGTDWSRVSLAKGLACCAVLAAQLQVLVLMLSLSLPDAS